MKACSIQEMAEAIRGCESAWIFPHIHMDGDALGSSAALCLALRQLGKQAWILTDEDTPKNLDFLENDCVLREPPSCPAPALSIMVDCCAENRIGERLAAFERGRERACLDHHSESVLAASLQYGHIEPEAAATGELVYALIRALGVAIDLPIATALYAAINTDTGSFQHANTTARTHRIAAELHEVPGFDGKKINVLLYGRRSLAAMRLESAVIGKLRILAEGHLAMGLVTQRMLEETGTRMEDTEGIIQRIMEIDGIEVACLIKEEEPEFVRASLRAKACANVAAVAASFGGGGHVRAAGCSLAAAAADAERQLAQAITDELERCQHE